MGFENGIDVTLMALLQALRDRWSGTKYISEPLDDAIKLVKAMSEQYEILDLQLSATERGLLEYRELVAKIQGMVHGIRSDKGLGFDIDNS